MSQKPPTRAMREDPDLDQLKRQAKELLDAYRAQQPEAAAEVNFYHRTATPDTFALHDAQFALARSYGFESWPKLKAAVDGVTAKKLHEAVERGDLGATRELLTRRPEIVDLGRGEMRAIHMAVLRRDLEMNLEPTPTPASGRSVMPPAPSPSLTSAATPKSSKPSLTLERSAARAGTKLRAKSYANSCKRIIPAVRRPSLLSSTSTPSWPKCAQQVM
jgi:hypothetical protein